MTKGECEFCHGRFYLDDLVRLALNYPQEPTDIFNEVLCHGCLGYLVAHYWDIAPELERYYHPA